MSQASPTYADTVLSPTGEDYAENYAPTTMSADPAAEELSKESAVPMAREAPLPAPQEEPEQGPLSSSPSREDLCDLAMSFVEGAEDMFTYHQAQLIRQACLGLDTRESLEAAQYVLSRARFLASRRQASRGIGDSFNDYIMNFVEKTFRGLTYIEADIVRRAARGCDGESIEEIQYLLDRARQNLKDR